MIPIDRDLDEEIATIELRIHQSTLRVMAKARRVSGVLQRSLTSPGVLLLAAGTGFAIGRITDRNGAQGQSRLARVGLSIFEGAGAALKLVRAPAFVWFARLFSGRSEAKPSRPMAPSTDQDGRSTTSVARDSQG